MAFQASLTPGKRVVTSAGIHGTVVNVRDTEVDVEVAHGTTITFDKMAIIRAPHTADAVNNVAAPATSGDAIDGSVDSEYREGDYSNRDFGEERNIDGGYESGYDSTHPDDQPRER